MRQPFFDECEKAALIGFYYLKIFTFVSLSCIKWKNGDI